MRDVLIDTGEKARQSIERRLADAYEVLGQDEDEADVETLLGVQAEELFVSESWQFDLVDSMT